MKYAPYTRYRNSFIGVPGGIAYDFEFNNLASVPVEAESEALSRMHSKIRESRSEINGFAFLGELRETLKMIRKPLSSLTKQVYSHLERTEVYRSGKKKRLPRKSVEYSKALSGTALEINFGWKPVISDIQAIALIAAKVVAGHGLRKQFSTFSELKSSEEYFDGYWNPDNGSYIRGQQTRRYEYTVGAKVSVGVNYREECASDALSQVIRLGGFTTEQILPAIYELTPWSWLIDYFSNLGDLIEAATTDLSDVVYFNITKYSTRKSTRLIVPFYYEDSYYRTVELTGNAYTHSHVCTSATRQRFNAGSYPVPSLRFQHPFESVTRLTNLVSVLDQLRPSIRR